MNYLYIRPNGTPHHKHSFSAGIDFDMCPLKYKLRRIDGWREKDTKAALKFGRALESAIQFYHETGGKGGVEEFTRLWAEQKEQTDITYTKVEKDWESLNRAGREMMVLYAIRQPSLPIPLTAAFQREMEKEVFPGHPDLGGITHAGKLDIVARIDPHHPLLPEIEWNPEWGLTRTIIVDIKTSGLTFDDRPGMCAFDAQLRNYSWLTGIRDVCFLWFKKSGHRLQKGSTVSFLTDTTQFKGGDEGIVAQVLGEQAYVVKNDAALDEMEKAQGRKVGADGRPGALMTTKDSDVRKAAWLSANADLVDLDILSRQRVQFNAGVVKKESADAAGFVVGRQITGIVNAWKANNWPNTFGVRYPNDSRHDSYFRAFVEEDKMFKEAYFKQITDGDFDDLLVVDEDPEEVTYE
jgi:hypothetical protein